MPKALCSRTAITSSSSSQFPSQQSWRTLRFDQRCNQVNDQINEDTHKLRDNFGSGVRAGIGPGVCQIYRSNKWNVTLA